MVTFPKGKFAPKSQAAAPAKEKRPSLALKIKEVGEEKAQVLCFVRECTSKKNASNKFFVGGVAARDEEGNIIKNEKGWAEESGVVFFFFPKKEGGQLCMKDVGEDKANPVCDMIRKDNDKGMMYYGKDEAGNQYFLDKPLPKK